MGSTGRLTSWLLFDACRMQPGELIGSYQIETEVGHGDFGSVYRAFDPQFNRPVAIKMLPPHALEDPQAAERFQRAVNAVMALKHPQIAQAYAFGEQDGIPYIVFEWVEGRSLKTILENRGTLTLQRTLTLTDQIGPALDFAHRQGIVHGDIKPANLLIGPADRIMIVDFGLIWLGTSPESNAAGRQSACLSPEQIHGETVDGRADQFSLAAVVFQMLTGKPADDAQARFNFLHSQPNWRRQPAALRKMASFLPAAVKKSLLRAMAENPQERFTTVEEFTRALHGKPSPWQLLQTKPFKPGRRQMLSGAGLLIILILLLTLGWLWQPRAAVRQPPGTASVLQTGVPGSFLSLPSGIWALPGGNPQRSNAPVSNFPVWNDQPRWSQICQPSRASNLLAGYDLVLVVLEGGLVRALNWLQGNPAWEVSLGSAPSGDPTLWPEEPALALIPIEAGLAAISLAEKRLLWNIDTSQLQGNPRGGVLTNAPGAFVATDQGWLHALEPASGTLLWSLDLSPDSFIQPLSALDELLFLPGQNQVLYAVNHLDQTRVWSAGTLGAPLTPVSVSASARLALIGTDGGWLQAFSIQDGHLAWQTQVEGLMQGLALDEKRAYTTFSNGSLAAWELSTGKQLWTINLGEPLSAAPMTDGQNLLIATQGGSLRWLDAASGQEDSNRRIQIEGEAFGAPVVAGEWLFLAGQDLYAFGP